MPDPFDIAVIGGGPTGHTAAIAAALAGCRTVLYAPPAPSHPARTAALMQPAIAFLDSLGVPVDRHREAASLSTIRLVDGTRRLVRAPEVAFRAGEVGLKRFGVNIPNAALVQALAERARGLDNLTIVEAPAMAVTPGDAYCAIASDAGPESEARLVVGADGRESVVRKAASVRLRLCSYRQSALVAAFSTRHPHGGVSTEFHREAGPFTLVPLAGNRVSLVWVDRPAMLEEALGWSEDRFNAHVERLAASVAGEMRADTGRAVYPLSGGVAERFAGNRIVLAGDAAHVLPPIGAQGLNLGFRDVATLAGLLSARPADPGSSAITGGYGSRRSMDIHGRFLMTDLLNRSLLTGFLPVPLARAAGLAVARSLPVVRQVLIRQGLGPGLAAASEPSGQTAAPAGGRS